MTLDTLMGITPKIYSKKCSYCEAKICHKNCPKCQHYLKCEQYTWKLPLGSILPIKSIIDYHTFIS